MARKNKLFSLAPKLKQLNIGVILIYISEAHSTKWPIGLEYMPEPQKNIEERLSRAQEFANSSQCPYPIYVDTWENSFDDVYQSWPDKFYWLDENLVIKNQARYDGPLDAVVVEDYAELLLRRVQELAPNLIEN